MIADEGDHVGERLETRHLGDDPLHPLRAIDLAATGQLWRNFSSWTVRLSPASDVRTSRRPARSHSSRHAARRAEVREPDAATVQQHQGHDVVAAEPRVASMSSVPETTNTGSQRCITAWRSVPAR